LGKPVGTPQLFETVMLLVGAVEQEACAPDVAHTVPESPHAPGLVLGSTSALTVALFCTLVEVASNSTDQFMTALPFSVPTSTHVAPAGDPEGHETVDTTVVAAPGTAGGTAGVPALKTTFVLLAGRESMIVT
jgi:hypothetical protein